MGFSIEQCHRSIQELDQEVLRFERRVRHSTFKLEELEQVDQKIQQTMNQLRQTLEVLENEKQNGSCFTYSGRKMCWITGLSIVTVLFTGGGLACAAFGTTEVVKWGGFILGSLTGTASGATTWYTTKISIESEKKNQLIEVSQEGLKNAKLFKNFIKSYRQLKKDEFKELKQSVKKMEKRKSRLMGYMEKNEATDSPKRSAPSLAKPSLKDEDQKDIQLASVLTLIPQESDSHLDSSISQYRPEAQSQTKQLDEKITECLSQYEALPKKYMKEELYWQLVSHFIQELPNQDSLKQELLLLANHQTKTDDETSESHEKKGLLSTDDNSKDYISQETEITTKYSRLTKVAAERFKIRRAIPHLDAPNGYRVTSRGTMRINRKESKDDSLSLIITEETINGKLPRTSRVRSETVV